jgi:hypothetical protein
MWEYLKEVFRIVLNSQRRTNGSQNLIGQTIVSQGINGHIIVQNVNNLNPCQAWVVKRREYVRNSD